MPQTRIQGLDRERQQAEAARVAALGTNFDPLDPSLDDVLKGSMRSTSFAQSKGAWVVGCMGACFRPYTLP